MRTLLDALLGVKPRSATLPNAPVAQFLDGEAAWIVGSEDELLDRLAAGRTPVRLIKSTAGRFFKAAAVCFAAMFMIALIASQVQHRVPKFVDEFFALVFFIVFIAMIYYGVRGIVAVFTGPRWNKKRAWKSLSSAVGGPWTDKLAVVFYQPDELNAHTREVVDHMRLVYAMADAQGLPITPQQWRSLTDEAVQATDLYFNTGDLTLAKILREQVDMLVPYRTRW